MTVLRKIQGEHKYYPDCKHVLQKKLRGIQTFFFLPLLKLVSKFLF